MTNFEKLEKLNRKTVPVTIKVEGQEVILDIKKVGSQNAKLLNFSKKDEDMSVDELIEKTKPLVKFCADLSEEQYNELTVDVLMELFEAIMNALKFEGKKKEQENLLEKAREMRESKQ